jgi:secreted PhoX family phosphatase
MRAFPLDYRVLYRSGDRFGATGAGLIVNQNGEAILRSPPDRHGRTARGPFRSVAPDGTTLIRAGAKGERLFLLTQFEYHTEGPNLEPDAPPVALQGKLPMVMNLAELKQDPQSGLLTVATLRNVDLAAVRGLRTPCAATLTPWSTHLLGEEYEPNAADYEHRPLEPMNLYLGTPGKNARAGGARPYDYGRPVEIALDENGQTHAERRYAMGRLSFELAEIMPDERTAYLADDARDGVLLMFVADRARDLSAGTLYAARWQQQDAGGGALRWIRLGRASDAEIEAIVARGTGFSDIFERLAPDDRRADARDRAVQVFQGPVAKERIERLRLKPGMAQAAAFLESRRYAAYLGATSEFTQIEGITHNARDRRLYLAFSAIGGGMIAGQNGARPQDHIRLRGDAPDLACGAVYQAELLANQKDTEGRAIASEWVAVNLRPLLSGGRKPRGQGGYGRYDRCDTDRIANPDNIRYAEELRTLFIAEDSAGHLNNFLWAYHVDTKRLTRILSAPLGAEITGLQALTGVNGHAYILANIQHPGASRELEHYPPQLRRLGARVDRRGAVGYLGGLPEIRRQNNQSK